MQYMYVNFKNNVCFSNITGPNYKLRALKKPQQASSISLLTEKVSKMVDKWIP